MRTGRLIAGAVLAPLIVPILYFLVSVLFSGYTDQSPWHMQKLLDLTIGTLTPLSYVFSFPAGLAILVCLLRLDRLTAFNCVLSSAVVGTVVGYIFALITSGPDHRDFTALDNLAVAGIACVCAVGVALTFSLIAGIRRR